jgi:hypothetical protein
MNQANSIEERNEHFQHLKKFAGFKQVCQLEKDGFDIELSMPILVGLNLASTDQFISNVFTLSSGVYTYDAAVVSGAGVTLTAGVTAPPAITRSIPSYAGLKLTGTTNHITVSNVTSTSNGYGISFATANNGYNTVSESEFLANTQYDLYSASNATNTFSNNSFVRTSSTITGTGPVLVNFNVRARATRVGGAAIASVLLSAIDGFSYSNTLGLTGASGYTSFASVPAYKLTSSSLALTNGGFNPYTVSSTVDGYVASSTSVTIASRNQTVSMVLLSSSAPTAPSSATVSAIGTTTSTFAWSDNADDEAAYIIDYVNLSTGETFPGTISTLAADTTSTVITGLSPNVAYQVRVQATSTNLGSAHSTRFLLFA